ncbi:MAG: precorrin-2 C(20)-methyltransferase [Heliomarina sp.]|uniref:precorrin-2 C(20)-methyltransferase n=1 Tax=Heliomarina sp. TaxID=2917556 RepID=UPI004059063A
MSGTVYGLGLGPGDPDLLSVRADRLLRQARHVAFFRKAGRKGQARQIVESMIPADAVEIPMEYPVTTEIPLSDPRYNEILSAFYAEQAEKLSALVADGHDIVVLCEGDPFFYGSFMHLHSRLKDIANVEVVPAITGMSAAWTATDMPITWGDDVLTILMGTLPEEELRRHMQDTDALVIMKIGTNIAKIRRALDAVGLTEKAWMVQYAAMPRQTVTPLVEADCEKAPYFSIIVVHGQGRRP